MLTISVTELVALLIVLPLFGAMLGYMIAVNRMRRAAGGKTPVELREELDEYRAGVTSHFQQTADLLDGMTDQYRAVYTHMAQGAMDLCDPVESGPRLEQLRAGLLEVAQAAAVDGDDANGRVAGHDAGPDEEPGSAAAGPRRDRPAA